MLGQHSTVVGTLAPGTNCPGFDSQHSQKISEETIVDAAEVYQQRWLEESGQWLENVY